MKRETQTVFEMLDERGRIIADKIEAAGRLAEDSLRQLAAHTLAIAAGLFVVAVAYVLAAPFLLQSSAPELVSLGAVPYIFAALTYLCHQMPERSLMISGAPFPVCARDIGIYVGAALGVLTPALVQKTRGRLASIAVLVIAFIPIGLDGVSQSIMGLRESSNALRLATGLAFGFGVVGWVTARILSKYEGFAATITSRVGLAVTGMGVILFSYVLYGALVTHAGFQYVTYENATRIARETTGLQGNPLVYYVPPQAPASIQADKFLPGYEDYVLRDISDMAWAKREYAILVGNDTVENTSTLPTRHRLGVWAVIFP